jgi:hypothetical protein
MHTRAPRDYLTGMRYYPVNNFNQYLKCTYLPISRRNEAVECGKLIDQAYAQYTNATAPTHSATPWALQGGYVHHGSFSALEQGKMLPFGFVASKDSHLFVVIRGTTTT